jgi:hypothetical protein
MNLLAAVRRLRPVEAAAITLMVIVTVGMLALLRPVVFPPSYKVATWYAPKGSVILRPNTGVSGVLHGQANADGSACFWLAADGEDREALEWPPGYSARPNPLSIYDQDGHIVATVGDDVILGGGTAPEAVIASGIFGCPKTWSVVGVSQR